jgi:hypothetical protein
MANSRRIAKPREVRRTPAWTTPWPFSDHGDAGPVLPEKVGAYSALSGVNRTG